jgi:ABC-type polysaccharide/polyol phosphate export permease
MIVGIWRYRQFILKNALAELRYRYAGSALGVFWNVVNPLTQILVYTIVFSNIMAPRLGSGSSTVDFTLYLCSGLLPWVAFSECVLRGANAFIENASYLKKLPIPEQVFVAQNAVSATLGLTISMSLLFVLTLVTAGRLSVSWIGVPIVLVLFQAFGFGIGLLLSTVNAFLRDIGQVLGIGLQLWMWTTPIVYVEDILAARLRSLLPYNPAYPFIDALHRMIVSGEWPLGGEWVSMVSWALVAPLAGYLVLRAGRVEIRDVL